MKTGENLQIVAFTFFDLYLPVGKNKKKRDIHFSNLTQLSIYK